MLTIFIYFFKHFTFLLSLSLNTRNYRYIFQALSIEIYSLPVYEENECCVVLVLVDYFDLQN